MHVEYVPFFWTGNDRVHSSWVVPPKKGKMPPTPKRKGLFGEALFLTTSHLLVSGTIINLPSKDNNHPLFYALPFKNPGFTAETSNAVQGMHAWVLVVYARPACLSVRQCMLGKCT